jgi:HAD superfamily hydrolase (TIGR01549 family)
MGTRVVFFDWGGTLARTWVSEGHHPAEFWQKVLEQNGVVVDPTALRGALDEFQREFGGRIYEYLGRTPEFWKELDGRVMARLGIEDRRDALMAALDREIHRASVGELYPETRATLRALAERRVPLGVISNHNDALPGILAYHEIGRFFRTVTYSQEAGAEKPDRRVFDLALQRAECRPEEAVFVGDSWEADYVGASRLGIRAIWLNRRGLSPPAPCETVRDLGEVLPLLSE